MESFYGYETALWYWRTVAARQSEPRRVTRFPEPDSYVHTELQELSHRPNWLDPSVLALAGNVVHPLVFHRNRRRTGSPHGYEWHLWSKVPHSAFVPAGEGSFVSSPEFVFLQMASKLEFVQLVALGMELCGLYSLDPDEEKGLGTRSTSLTTCARIAAFLDENEGARGRRAAQTALQYLADGSASPMETTVYLQLCLPVRRGGYGLPRPKLNFQIDLNGDARRLSGLSKCYGDLCWPKEHLDLEYLGEEAHEGAMNMLADRRRTLAIEEMGYEVIEITEEQALDMATFDVVARRTAARLGKRLYREAPAVHTARMRLFNVLEAWRTGGLQVTREKLEDQFEYEPAYE